MTENRKYKYYFLFAMLLCALLLHLLSPVITTTLVVQAKLRQQSIIAAGKAEARYKVVRLSKEQVREFSDREGREIRLDGELFDIVKLEADGDNITCTVLEDEKETTLVSRLADLVGSAGSAKNVKQVVLWWPVGIIQQTALCLKRPLIFVARIIPGFKSDCTRCGYRPSIIRPPRPLVS